MSNPLKDFFRSHPAVIKAIEGLEHAGVDAAEEIVLSAIGSKLGLLSHLFPVQAALDAGKAAVEHFVDSKLDALAPADPAPAALFAPPPADPVAAARAASERAAATPAAPPAAPPVSASGQTDPTMIAKQAAATARLLAQAEQIDAGGKVPGQRFTPILVE